MPSSFNIPTLEETHAVLVADYANRFPLQDVSKFSDNWKRLRTTAMAASALHYHLKVLYDDLLPDTANGPRLDRWGTILNAPRKQATPASKALALRCTGAVGATVNIGDTLVHKDGTRYQANSAGTVPALGTYVDVDILAISTGSATRKTAGEVLTFEAAPAGFDTVATLQLDMDVGGFDVETDGDYRVRLLEKIAQPGMGGNSNDYEVWALEVDGVEAAYVYPLRGGLGSVHVACLHGGTGAQRALTGGEVAAVQAHIDAVRPVSVADFVVLAVTAEPNDVEQTVIPEDDAAYAFDWDDQSVPLTVSAWNAGTRVLKLSANRPASMDIGDRLVYKCLIAPKNTGKEMVIEAFTGNPDEVVLKDDPDLTAAPPVAGNPVYSGGPLVQPIRQADIDHIDTLGPARGAFASGSWVGTLYTARLFAISQTTKGVLDSTVVTPVANVSPANAPPTPSVGFITARQVIVRRG